MMKTPMYQGLLKSSAVKSAPKSIGTPQVKSSKTCKLFNAGVSRNSKTAKRADPTCYNAVTVDQDRLFENVEMNMAIKVGDVVIWRHGKSKSKTSLPLGIEGCEVLEIGTAQDGQPAAKLKLPEFFAGLHKDACNAYVADLEI